MQIFLKRHIDLLDIIFFQELVYRFIKKVTLFTNRDGDDYSNTITYKYFIFLGVGKMS